MKRITVVFTLFTLLRVSLSRGAAVDELTGMGGIYLYSPLSTLLNSQWQDYIYLEDEGPVKDGMYVISLRKKHANIAAKVAKGQTSGSLEVNCGGPGMGLGDSGTVMFGTHINSVVIHWVVNPGDMMKKTPLINRIVITFRDRDAAPGLALFLI